MGSTVRTSPFSAAHETRFHLPHVLDELCVIIDDFVHLLFGQLLADRTVLTVISAIVFAIAVTTSSLSIAFCSPVIAGYSAKKSSITFDHHAMKVGPFLVISLF